MIFQSEPLCLELITGKYLHLMVTNRYNENSPKFMVWTDCYEKRHHVPALTITPKAVNYGHGDSLRLYTLLDGQSDKLNGWLRSGYSEQVFVEWRAGYFL